MTTDNPSLRECDEAVERIAAAIKEGHSDNASGCLGPDSWFQDSTTGRAIYVRDLKILVARATPLPQQGREMIRQLRFWESDGHPHGLLHGKAAAELERLYAERGGE